LNKPNGAFVLRLDGVHVGVEVEHLVAGLADLEAHPEVEEGVGHEARAPAARRIHVGHG